MPRKRAGVDPMVGKTWVHAPQRHGGRSRVPRRDDVPLRGGPASASSSGPTALPLLVPGPDDHLVEEAERGAREGDDVGRPHP